MRGALAHLSPDVEDVDAAPRRPPAARPRAARAAHDDHRRGDVQVQARAHPRGRLRRPLEERPRRPAPRRTRAGSPSGAGGELLEIRAFHLDQAARLLGELDGAPPPALAEEAADALTDAGRRALSREAFRSARKLLLRAVELAPTLDRRYLAARAAWRLGRLRRASPSRWRRSAPPQPRRRATRLEGRALTGLAEVALNFRARRGRRRSQLAERALGAARARRATCRSSTRSGRARTSPRGRGDRDAFRDYAERAIAVAQELGRKDLESLVTQALAQSYLMELDAEQRRAARPARARPLRGGQQRRRPRARRPVGGLARLGPRRRRGDRPRLRGGPRDLLGDRLHPRTRPRSASISAASGSGGASWRRRRSCSARPSACSRGSATAPTSARRSARSRSCSSAPGISRRRSGSRSSRARASGPRTASPSRRRSSRSASSGRRRAVTTRRRS